MEDARCTPRYIHEPRCRCKSAGDLPRGARETGKARIRRARVLARASGPRPGWNYKRHVQVPPPPLPYPHRPRSRTAPAIRHNHRPGGRCQCNQHADGEVGPTETRPCCWRNATGLAGITEMFIISEIGCRVIYLLVRSAGSPWPMWPSRLATA